VNYIRDCDIRNSRLMLLFDFSKVKDDEFDLPLLFFAKALSSLDISRAKLLIQSFGKTSIKDVIIYIFQLKVLPFLRSTVSDSILGCNILIQIRLQAEFYNRISSVVLSWSLHSCWCNCSAFKALIRFNVVVQVQIHVDQSWSSVEPSLVKDLN